MDKKTREVLVNSIWLEILSETKKYQPLKPSVAYAMIMGGALEIIRDLTEGVLEKTTRSLQKLKSIVEDEV